MMIFVVLGVAIVIFSIMYFIPGNPAQIILGSNASEEAIQELYVSMGLDQPYLTQLGTFLSDTFLHFDLGTSYQSKIAVATEIAERFPRTLIIAACSLIVTTAVGIPLGIVAATHQGKWQDNVAMLISMLGLSLPGFWLALMLVNWLSVGLGIKAPIPEWGALLNEGKDYFTMYPHLLIFPGLAIGLLSLATCLMGDGLRDAMDPRLKK